MSPEQSASAAQLARLRAEIAEDRLTLQRREEEALGVLAQWSSAIPSRPYLVYAAASLHSWYTGLEALLERIARTLDGGAPRGEQWHRELISQATAEVPNLRPAMLPRALRVDLLGLLAFRHFFRHAYGAEIDPPRLRTELERLERIAPSVDDSLARFDDFLARAEKSILEP